MFVHIVFIPLFLNFLFYVDKCLAYRCTMCTMCMQCLWRAEERSRFSGMGLTGSCEPSCGCSELSLHALQETKVLLTTKRLASLGDSVLRNGSPVNCKNPWPLLVQICRPAAQEAEPSQVQVQGQPRPQSKFKANPVTLGRPCLKN